MPHTGSVWGSTLLAVIALLPLTLPDAHARHGSADHPPRHGELAARAQAEKLRADGASALSEHRLEAARQALNESYEGYPASETLYYLGQLALAESHPTEAQDLLRRFVLELGVNIDPQQRKEAARILALPGEPNGELEVLGARSALLRVDNRLLGVLPLSQPLLLPSGPHSVQLTLGKQHMDGPVEIRTGRTAQLRFDLQTGVAVVTLPPTVLLVQDYGTAPAAAQEALAHAAQQAIRAEQHAVLHPRPALVRAPELTPCARTRACQVQLMQRNEVEYAIGLSVVVVPAAANPENGVPPPAGRIVLHGELLDASMGDEPVLTLDEPLDRVTAEQGPVLVGALVTRLLKEGRTRPRGTLEITSTPLGAQVTFPRGPAGVTPYARTTWAGPYEVVVEKIGYEPARLSGRIEADKKESLQVVLELLPPPPPPPPKRPLWRTITGAIAIGLGGTLVLTSASSLFSGDSSKVATGAGVTIAGSLLTVGGVLLLVLPVAKPKPLPPAADPPKVGEL